MTAIRSTRWACPVGAIVVLLFVAAGACTSESREASKPTPKPASTRSAVAHGTARRDGRAFDTRWIGAVVRRDRLVTACQAELPRIRDGHFGVTVYGASQAGCGGRGTSVRFWIYGGNQQIFNDRWVPWSRLAKPLALRFSTVRPGEPVPVRTQLSGRAFDAAGKPVPIGTRIEAVVDTTVCGVASVRRGGGFRGYILNVVGPDSVPACRTGATITFRIGGATAVQTAVNDGQPQRDLFRLTVAPPA
jgi:hypothetical protein